MLREMDEMERMHIMPSNILIEEYVCDMRVYVRMNMRALYIQGVPKLWGLLASL